MREMSSKCTSRTSTVLVLVLGYSLILTHHPWTLKLFLEPINQWFVSVTTMIEFKIAKNFEPFQKTMWTLDRSCIARLREAFK